MVTYFKFLNSNPEVVRCLTATSATTGAATVSQNAAAAQQRNLRVYTLGLYRGNIGRMEKNMDILYSS